MRVTFFKMSIYARSGRLGLFMKPSELFSILSVVVISSVAVRKLAKSCPHVLGGLRSGSRL